MSSIGSACPSTRTEKRESSCPYCGSLMSEGRCPNCGNICPRCGTPTKELPCLQCGYGSSHQGYSTTSSPAPAQSPELADVQRILGRTPSRREFNMVRGIVDRDRERIHKLSEMLCQRLQAPLSQELIEMRALQVLNKAAKIGSELTYAECVIFAFLEAAKQSGTLQTAMKALAEAQLLDSNLRLGLSKMKLAPLKFLVEVSGIIDFPVLLIDGEPRPCKTVELEALAHGRTYLLYWSPLLADCLGQEFGSAVRRVSAVIRGDSGLVPLSIAWKERPSEKRGWIDVTLDPRRFFYGFTTRKEIEVDIGIPGYHAVDSDAALMLRKLGRQLDTLETTKALFRISGGSTPSGLIWAKARAMISEPGISRIAVTPRKKAAAALIAADMRYYARLDRSTKMTLAFALRKIPLASRDATYTCVSGLIVPSELAFISGVEWADAFSLAVKF